MPRNTAQQLYDVGYVVYGGEREVGGREGGRREERKKEEGCQKRKEKEMQKRERVKTRKGRMK